MRETLSQFEKNIDEILALKEIDDTVLCKPLSEGKWSIREIVGHLYYWDKFILEKMVPLMGEGGNLPGFPEHDQHNEDAILFLKEYSVESIIDHFVATRKELTREMKNLAEDIRFTIGGGKRQFSGESFLKIFLKHDAHHIKQMKEKGLRQK
ncbi:DinB family protein [Halalkalibacterium halodurans]|uniref:DinB family protein n=1 Tax=Halalkalibacterium halodurans TaxID=86665 RepID=UPI002E1F7CAA|nr:DinB family protein [Halalkalibacterium halodurans]